jgi:hypothetical protein
MRRVIWSLVIWLLAAALPAQGLAAATMLHCAPQRGHGSQAAHAAHAHADTSAAQHHHGANGHHDAAHAVDATDAEHGVNAATALQKCSACATCCIGLALPSSMQSVPGPLSEPTARPAPAVVHAAFLTGGPERPPRAARA